MNTARKPMPATARATAPLRRFGEGAVATPANAITVARVLLAVPTLVLIAQRGASWPAVVLWLVLACTDGVDGWIARRDGTTRSGAFLDPLADKILVIGGFLALGVRGDIGWIPILLVVGREAGIQVYRSLAGRRGISLPARQLGKWKTTLQFAAVGVFLFPPFEDMAWLQQTVLWVAVALTLLSALDMLRRGWQESRVRCEVLAIGTELLLGQIVDTNSAWMGEKLADAGIDSFEHRQVGDNLGRMVRALRELLEESDAVIVCGGLGPTPDDMTRQAIADVMGVELERRDDLVEWVSALFTSRGRSMPENNLRQCDVPVGAEPIPNSVGTAPGIKALVGDKIVYAVPGVPYEMHLMMSEHVLPDLLARSGQQSAIVSRSLKTWGTSESGLAEMIAHRVDAQTNPTIAFLARGIEGLVVRMTAKASTPEEARALIEPEEQALREILGDLVFGVDDETMETVVLDLLRKRGLTLGLAESLTGGLVASRLVSVPGTSDVLKGGVVAYMTDAKRSVLGVTAESVVSSECARQLAEAARRVFGADVGLGVTGVAGPEEQEGQPAGTVFFGLAVGDEPAEAVDTQLPGQREMVRQFATISLLNLLRMKLLSME